MLLSEYRAGQYEPQYEYRSFLPSRIHHPWVVADPEVQAQVTHGLAERVGEQERRDDGRHGCGGEYSLSAGRRVEMAACQPGAESRRADRAGHHDDDEARLLFPEPFLEVLHDDGVLAVDGNPAS